MKTYDHIITFALLIIFIILGFLFVRPYMIPDSFGNHGSYTYAYYRADSKTEKAARAVVYQGTEHCATCHDSQAAAQQEGAHAALDCESCHGGFRAHNNNTSDRMAISDPINTCMVCHEALNARPSEFPQIDSFAAHLSEQDAMLEPDMSCADCHDPHMPM